MELHPFLETDGRPNEGWWYVLNAAGDCPSMRVGHSATHIKGKSSTDAGKLYIIGGANPSGPFSETFVLDLNTRSWDTVDSPGFRPRYEHAAFVPASHPAWIYVFGGANQAGNLNDVQYLDTETNAWSSVTPSGTAPSPRTHHASAAVGDRLVVYSGGQAGSDPVGDRQVHCFHAGDQSWSVLTVRGDPPKPRHGHAMAAVGSKVFVHGGMAGSTFYDDLHVLDLEKKTWGAVKKKRASPRPRAAHAMLACGPLVFLFGGLGGNGALDDLHRLDTTTMTWTRLDLQGPPPASRLDLAACVVSLRVPVAGHQATASGGLSATSGHIREVLDRELKPGSASSRDSWSDVNASEAVFPIEPTEEDQDIDASNENVVQTSSPAEGECEGGAAGGGGEEGGASVDMETVHVLLVNGGMDTEGEIFDDTLVFSFVSKCA